MTRVEGNARLTNSIAVVFFVLVIPGGLTILPIARLIDPHLLIDLIQNSPTPWEYCHDDGALREVLPRWSRVRSHWSAASHLGLLDPSVIVLSMAEVVSGVALVVVAPNSWHPSLLQIHQATLQLWFLVTAIHSTARLVETATLVPRDWFGRPRS